MIVPALFWFGNVGVVLGIEVDGPGVESRPLEAVYAIRVRVLVFGAELTLTARTF